MSDSATTSTSNPSNPTTASAQSTMPPHPPSTLPLTLILAATPKLGIGHLGQLPWPQLKTEMGYFARVTKRIPPAPSSQPQNNRKRINAVIMGRKTWDSIPERFRPLKGRLNVVVTRDIGAERWRTLDEKGIEGPLVAPSLEDAVKGLQERNRASTSTSTSDSSSQSDDLEVARVFVIGGSSIYKSALELPQTDRVLLTKMQTEFECDTFFPVDLEGEEGWRKVGKNELEEFVGEEVPGVVEEKGVRFEFCLFERSGDR